MNNNYILITGCAGFIGFHLSKRLCSEGYSVIGLDNMNSYYDVNLKNERLKILSKNFKQNFIYENIDITDINKLVSIATKFKIMSIINLAAQAGVRYSIENPREYIQTNIQGFSNILELCKQFNISNLIYASSSSVYGNNTSFPSMESDKTESPTSLYGASKKSNELMAYSYSHLFNINTIGLRFFTVYGPWGRPDMALFMFTKNMLDKKKINVYNNGNHSRSFTYIDDIIESIFRLFVKIKNNSKSGKYDIFNIGGENSIKLMDYIKIIEKELKIKADIRFLPKQPGDVIKSESSSQCLEKFISYKPCTNVENGIKFFIDWYQNYYQYKDGVS